MARWGSFLALASLVVGLALIGYAIRSGTADLVLLVIFPVVSGSSPAFLLGVLLTFVGIVGLMLSLSVGASFVLDEEPEAAGDAAPSAPNRSSSSAAGGVVLLGPVPIFFGAAKPVGRKYYLLAVAVALVLFVVVLALALLL
jgi:uncharacterized protein (TIGR00304 family)